MVLRRDPKDELGHSITRLVDAALRGASQSVVPSVEVERQVLRQRRVAQALRSDWPPVPASLLLALDALRRAATPRHRPRSLVTAATAALTSVGGAAVLAVAAALAVIFGLSLGHNAARGRSSIELAAKLVYAPATERVPPATSSDVLAVSFAGIAYPNYARQYGAVAAGLRRDWLGGRPTLTVFYRLPGGDRLSYTVYAGTPLPVPRSRTVEVIGGVTLRVLRVGSGITAVTLIRSGHTCVLAARLRPSIVLALAAAPLGSSAG